MRRHPALAWIALIPLLGSHTAEAQTPPDAGALRRQIEQQQRNTLPPRTEPQLAPPPPMESLGGAAVTVKSFRFVGNTLLTSAQLTPAVASYVGRSLDFAALQNAALAVAAVYRKSGWVVRVYLPQQDITGGTVTIQIVEALFGDVRLEGQARRIAPSRIKSTVERMQARGTPVNAESLERALLLLNDLPGLSARGRLSEGRNQAETDLVLTIADGPLVSGDLIADNAGARYTGEARLIADASLNSRLGLADRADLVMLVSEGSSYGRLAYSLPLGNAGWRVGANASHLSYDIVTSEFSALDPHGKSTAFGVEATYPLYRSRLKNLFAAVALDDKRFDNESAAETTTDYSSRLVTLGLEGNLFDSFNGGGVNTASVALSYGDLDLEGSPNEAIDALTTRAAGGFGKLRVTIARQQLLTSRVTLYGSFSGQKASKNLDSSEKFYLGGSTGVRAYPESEGGGSEALLVNLEARVRLPARLHATGFFDWGSVHVNEDNNIAGAATPNTIDLKGVGVALAWRARFGLSLSASLSRRVGHNPAATLNGDDQDGSLDKNRFWLQASLPF